MRKRTQAREITLQALYQFDIERQIEESVLRGVDDFEGFIVESTDDPEVRDYARRLLDGVLGSLEELDAQIAAVSENWRLNRTAARFVMPEVPEEMFFDSLRALLEVDRDWLPTAEQGSLYIRPSYFSIDPTLNVTPGRMFRYVLMTAPVGRYFAGTKSVSLVTTREFVRAFPGGTGGHKPGANYGPTMLASVDAQGKGYDNVIWLDGREGRYVEECGVMNMWFVIDGTAVTPPIDSGTILPGVTRDSLIQLCADFGVPCEERRISVDELLDAHSAGKLEEAFGSGTAATVQPIDRMGIDGTEVRLATGPGSLASRLMDELFGIQTGRVEDRHGWLWHPLR